MAHRLVESMKAEDLFYREDRQRLAVQPEMDALTVDDALMESGLVGLRYDAFRQTAGLLVDLAGALNYRAGNVALLFVRDVDQYRCVRMPSPVVGMKHYWHVILSQRVTYHDDRFNLKLGMLTNITIDVTGAAVEFYVGTMPALPDRHPNLVEDDVVAINDGFPRWDMEFIPEHATFTDHW